MCQAWLSLAWTFTAAVSPALNGESLVALAIDLIYKYDKNAIARYF